MFANVAYCCYKCVTQFAALISDKKKSILSCSNDTCHLIFFLDVDPDLCIHFDVNPLTFSKAVLLYAGKTLDEPDDELSS